MSLIPDTYVANNISLNEWWCFFASVTHNIASTQALIGRCKSIWLAWLWPLINAINRDWTFEYHAGLVHLGEFEKKSIQIFKVYVANKMKWFSNWGVLQILEEPDWLSTSLTSCITLRYGSRPVMSSGSSQLNSATEIICGASLVAALSWTVPQISTVVLDKSQLEELFSATAKTQ